jgi:chromosomal replication initiation ATPase DnaA
MSIEGDIKARHRAFVQYTDKVGKEMERKKRETDARKKADEDRRKAEEDRRKAEEERKQKWERRPKVIQLVKDIPNLHVVHQSRVAIVKRIINDVCDEHSLQYRDLYANTNRVDRRSVIDGRREVSYLLRTKAFLQPEVIAKLFGVKDTSTVRKRISMQRESILKYVESLEADRIHAILRETRQLAKKLDKLDEE